MPPSLSNWQVHRAWADGALNLVHRLQEFLNLENIDRELVDLDLREQQRADRRPVGENNPWKTFKELHNS